MTRTPRSRTGLALCSMALLAGVVGCGDYNGETAQAGYGVGTKSDALTTKCGADKYNGPQGADVSYYQNNFVWTGKGLKFGYARISDGAPNIGFVDPRFDANWADMKAAGVLRGAYQFFRPGQNATDQANFMVQKVGGKLGAGDLPCMIDVEATDSQPAATIISKMKTWMSIVESGTGKKPIIYTGAYFWQDNVANTADFASYPLWIAAYYSATSTACPKIPDAWSNWTIWQYCDGEAQYCTNGSGFDRDVFNGTDTDLANFAGGSGTVTGYYGASYVEQSFPLATTALQMTQGQTIPSYITLKNSGTADWDSNTRLATTQPRDRASAFPDSSWINDHRAAGVTGTVAPGGTFKFQFNLHAPQTPGDYHEYFGVVEEGKTWFSDPGQGGPADDQIQAWIHVVAADWAGKFVSQTFPAASDPPIIMEQGSTLDGTITLENIGTQTWTNGKTLLAPTPRDTPSPLADPSWVSPTRVSTVAADVPPGGSFAFPVTLHAGAVGDYTQTFGLDEDGVTWFADAPKGGGPADDLIKLHVVVLPAGTTDGGTGADGGPHETSHTTGPDSGGGCGCRIGERAPGNTSGAPVLLLLGLGWLARRRYS